MSNMMTLGAPSGGTTRGGQYGRDIGSFYRLRADEATVSPQFAQRLLTHLGERGDEGVVVGAAGSDLPPAEAERLGLHIVPLAQDLATHRSGHAVAEPVHLLRPVCAI